MYQDNIQQFLLATRNYLFGSQQAYPGQINTAH